MIRYIAILLLAACTPDKAEPLWIGTWTDSTDPAFVHYWANGWVVVESTVPKGTTKHWIFGPVAEVEYWLLDRDECRTGSIGSLSDDTILVFLSAAGDDCSFVLLARPASR